MASRRLPELLAGMAGRRSRVLCQRGQEPPAAESSRTGWRLLEHPRSSALPAALPSWPGPPWPWPQSWDPRLDPSNGSTITPRDTPAPGDSAGTRPAPSPGAPQTRPLPDFPAHFYKSSSGIPPPPPRRGLGVTCDPWQMVRGLPALPRNCCSRTICQAAPSSRLPPGPAALGPPDRRPRQPGGAAGGDGGSGGSWWLSLPPRHPPNPGMRAGGGLWDPGASGRVGVLSRA